jgi:hypothetical protein
VGLTARWYGMKAVGAVVLQGNGGAPVVDGGSGKVLQHRRRATTVRAAPNRRNAERWWFSP